ncbi:MAG: YfhO family protein [Lachnospiraceae bacterium]|nr:YfhO family protein [Lachnospiraceae bacterium]
MTKENWFYKNKVVLIGVLIVVLTHLITMLVNKCTFFGENVYTGGDNTAQYLGYASEIRRKIAEGESFIYSWRSVGGLGFHLIGIGFIANITSFILALFPYNLFNDVCDVLVVLHSVLMFLTMSFYLLNRESGKRIDKDSYEQLLFSVPYALLPAFCNASLYCTFLIEFVLILI